MCCYGLGNGFVNTEFARRAALLPRAGMMTHQSASAGGGGNTTCIGEEEDSSLRGEGGGVGWGGGGWGVKGWVLPNVVVEHVESRRFGLAERAGGGGGMGGGGVVKEGLWARTYGNYPLYLMKMNLIAMGLYPLRSPNRCAHVSSSSYDTHVSSSAYDTHVSVTVVQPVCTCSKDELCVCVYR